MFKKTALFWKDCFPYPPSLLIAFSLKLATCLESPLSLGPSVTATSLHYKLSPKCSRVSTGTTSCLPSRWATKEKTGKGVEAVFTPTPWKLKRGRGESFPAGRSLLQKGNLKQHRLDFKHSASQFLLMLLIRIVPTTTCQTDWLRSSFSEYVCDSPTTVSGD